MRLTAFNYISGICQEKTIEAVEENLSKYLIGRHPNCDFILNSPEVSRVHGIILYHNQNYYYIDLASSDGSRINNHSLVVNQSHILESGDGISIGNFFILVELDDENFFYDSHVFFDSSIEDSLTKKLTLQEPEFTVICNKIIPETNDVKTFCLVADPPILFNDISFNYQPGQFIVLNLNIKGKQIKCPYFISSSPSRPYNLQITVKRCSTPDLVSHWLYNCFQIGDKIKISPPMGNFNYFDNSYKKLLFICADNGIIPLISMIRWLYDTANDFSISFLYSLPSQKDILFREELELIATKCSNFNLAINLTSDESHETWSGYRGRLNETILLEFVPDLKERAAYVCGSEDFLDSIKTILKQLEFPMDNYYQENLGKSKIAKPVLKSNSPNSLVIDG